VEKSSIASSNPSQSKSNDVTPLSDQPLSVNMEALSEIMSFDEELKQELVELYLRQTNEDFGKLKKAFAMQDSVEVKRFAHRMIGGSAACGMTTLVDSLRELECLAETGNLNQIQSVLVRIENEFNRIRIFLRKLISSNAA
jgi:HPt (histidine-containing phosphotransfer) domain-containing protein